MIRRFDFIEMLVIAFAGLVIEAQHADFIHDVRQPVLVRVGAARKRSGQSLDRDLHKGAAAQYPAFVHEPLGPHVAHDSNTLPRLSTKATEVVMDPLQKK